MEDENEREAVQEGEKCIEENLLHVRGWGIPFMRRITHAPIKSSESLILSMHYSEHYSEYE